MSAKSDKYEKDVADSINLIPGVKAERPKVSAAYADVRLFHKNKKTWLEVKMSHTDNLSNPRMFFNGKKWDTTYKTPAAKFAVEMLNKSPQTAKFVKDLAKFANMQNITIPTSIGGLKADTAVPLDVMKKYFAQGGVNRYIMNNTNIDLGKIVTLHYTEGKTEPAYYMQAGDDFYMISNKNPLSLPKDIPILTGTGEFKVRIGTRSAFYEVQAEIKIAKMPTSKYSLMPGTKKKNPFLR